MYMYLILFTIQRKFSGSLGLYPISIEESEDIESSLDIDVIDEKIAGNFTILKSI